MCFTDAPPIDDDPQARLLVQVQGVIAEYEKAKMAERQRRGKLFKVRAGEAIFTKVPYGYRRVPRSEAGPARYEIYEPEAAVVRRIFDDYVAGGHSIRQIAKRLYADGIPSPTGTTGLGQLDARADAAQHHLHGQGVLVSPRERALDPADGPTDPSGARPEGGMDRGRRAGHHHHRHLRGRTAHRRPQHRVQRLAAPRPTAGCCEVWWCADRAGSSAAARGRRPAAAGATTTTTRCAYHNELKAGGPDRRCRERQIRADELDDFVFDQIREAMLRPELLTAGEAALASREPVPDDELLAGQLARLQRRLAAAQAERPPPRRLLPGRPRRTHRADEAGERLEGERRLDCRARLSASANSIPSESPLWQLTASRLTT